MKIITSPVVSTMWTPQFRDHDILDLPPGGDDYTRIGSFAAKTCYRSFGEKGRPNEDNQRRIIESKHGRILEHMYIGFHISGISRALGNELITHKAGITVSQESTRYVSMENAGYVLEPYLASIYHREQTGELRPDSLEGMLLQEHLMIASAAIETYEEQYRRLVELAPDGLDKTSARKWARGKARNVLPLGLETSMVVTGNLRAWRHFIEMRSERYAEAEIRRLAFHLFTELHREAPLYFDDYDFEVIDGWPEYRTPHRKV